MGINFPNAPTTGQLYPQPPVAGQPIYRWDGAKWTTQGGTVGQPIYISDTPPTGAPAGSLWWESDSGVLYIYYNDGDSMQWVPATPYPDLNAFLLKSGGTLTGPLTLAADPAAALQAATKQYVDAAYVPSAGRFGAASNTLVQFMPFNGSGIKINGIIYNIPAGGISAGNTSCYIDGVVGNLAASTTYYVYVFNNAGTPTIDFSTTGYVSSAVAGNVGVMAKSGDATRSLVGMIRTTSGAQFSDGLGQRLVLSWFNQRDIYANVSLGNQSTTSTALVQIGTNIIEMLNWSNKVVEATISGQGQVQTAAYGGIYVGVDIAGSTYGNGQYVFATTSAYWFPLVAGGWNVLVEGYHKYMGSFSVNTAGNTIYFNNNLLSAVTSG
jgi:hypothetical protein